MKHNCRAGTLLLVAVLAACEGPTAPKPKGPDPFPSVPYQVVACPAIEPPTAAAVPLDSIPLGRLPAGFAPPYYAYVDIEGDTLTGNAIIDHDAAGNVSLVAPIHPSASPDGGAARVWVTDGTRACAPFTFTVQPLPPAPGELAALLDDFRVLIAAKAAALGTTTEELFATAPADLPENLLPLALFATLLDGPDNDRSIAAIVAGTSPLAAEARLDVLEPLLARSGLRASLGAMMQFGSSAADASTGAQSLSVPLDECAASQANLHACMAEAVSALTRINGVTGQVLADMGEAIAVAALVPGLSVPATVLGFMGWLASAVDHAQAYTNPSEFTRMDIQATPQHLAEDEARRGIWAARVTATSLEWNWTKQLVSLVTQLGSIASLKNIKLEGTVVDLFGSGTAADVVSFLGTLLANNWDAWEGSLDDASLTIPARLFGPVNVFDAEYTERAIALGNAIALVPVNHSWYEGVNVGTSVLVARTAGGKFGGRQISADIEITVHALQVNIFPDDIFIAPEDDAEFTVTVNLTQQNAVELYPPHVDSLKGSIVEPLTLVNTDLADDRFAPGVMRAEYRLRYKAPKQDSTAVMKPDLLSVRDTAKTGARANSSVERIATAVIRFGSLWITPRSACVQPGDTASFSALVTGAPNQTVDWSASLGQINSSGVYTAPTSAAIGTEVTIRAVSRPFPALKDSVTIQVGCVCGFSLTVDGNTYTAQPGDTPSYAYSPDFGVLYLFMNQTPPNPEDGGRVSTLWFETMPAGPGVYPASGAGNLAVPFGHVWEKMTEREDLPDDMIHIELTAFNPGVVIAGTAIGTVTVEHILSDESPIPSWRAPFSATFSFANTTPILPFSHGCVVRQ